MFSLGNGTVADGSRLPLLVTHHWENVQSRRNFSLGGLTINVCVWPPQCLTQNQTFTRYFILQHRLENSLQKI